MAPDRSHPLNRTSTGASASPRPRHVALVGTTASGKSALALELARHDPAIELVSVDSMQVYRGMDVGTAKPTVAERAEVPHHMIDVADPWDDFTLAWFAREARRALKRHLVRRVWRQWQACWSRPPEAALPLAA